MKKFLDFLYTYIQNIRLSSTENTEMTAKFSQTQTTMLKLHLQHSHTHWCTYIIGALALSFWHKTTHENSLRDKHFLGGKTKHTVQMEKVSLILCSHFSISCKNFLFCFFCKIQKQTFFVVILSLFDSVLPIVFSAALLVASPCPISLIWL